jgi:hypothetical protein
VKLGLRIGAVVFAAALLATSVLSAVGGGT